VKIRWLEDNIPAYESFVAPALARLRKRWADASGQEAFSILLAASNDALSLAAQVTNKSTDLGKTFSARPSSYPDVVVAQQASLQAARSLRVLIADPDTDPTDLEAAREFCSSTWSKLKSILRSSACDAAILRDQRLHMILENHPLSLFSFI
jgi:hypothetical protein